MGAKEVGWQVMGWDAAPAMLKSAITVFVLVVAFGILVISFLYGINPVEKGTVDCFAEEFELFRKDYESRGYYNSVDGFCLDFQSHIGDYPDGLKRKIEAYPGGKRLVDEVVERRVAGDREVRAEGFPVDEGGLFDRINLLFGGGLGGVDLSGEFESMSSKFKAMLYLVISEGCEGDRAGLFEQIGFYLANRDSDVIRVLEYEPAHVRERLMRNETLRVCREDDTYFLC
jgi:hypothetical protein